MVNSERILHCEYCKKPVEGVLYGRTTWCNSTCRELALQRGKLNEMLGCMKSDIDEEFKKTPLQNYPVRLQVSHAVFDKLTKESGNEKE